MVAADATAAIGAGAIWLVYPDVPLFRTLLWLFGFHLAFALLATVRSHEYGFRDLFDEGLRKAQIGLLVRMLYFVDANVQQGHGIESPLGPLAAGWFIFDTIINMLDSCEKGKIGIGPLKKVLDIMRAKSGQEPPDSSNPAAAGSVVDPR